ncbi:MAG: MgtC/SapB family protein [Acidobacteriota bacterium]
MDLQLFRTFGEALALGLLIGSERYRGRQEGDSKAAGIRTFALIALLGASAGLIQNTVLTLLSFAAFAALLIISYLRDSPADPGLTTEMAALLTFWLGYLLREYETLALSTGIVVVILLASKRPLHDFIRNRVSESEFFGTLKFLAVVFVVLPLLPDRDLGPYGFLNPHQAWMLVILISAISYAGYVLVRIYGGERGLTLSSLLGGMVSTTAVTLALAGRARESASLSRFCAFTGVMTGAVQFPRLLFVIWLVDGSLGMRLLGPLTVMTVVGLVVPLLVRSRVRLPDQPGPIGVALKNPFSILPVLRFAFFLIAVLLVAKAAGSVLGATGVYAAAAVSGLGGVTALGLSVADMVARGTLEPGPAALAVLIAVAANMLSKTFLAAVNGTREMGLWLGIVFLLMLAAGGAVLLVPGF